MKQTLKKSVSRYARNLRGWRTNRKIIVIESDDWGSIRMPSREAYEKCLRAGYRVDKNPYERYDSLASEEDLQHLFNILTSYKDQNNHPPVITANVLAGNPDFEKIRESGFKEYHFEPVTRTLQSYPFHNRCFELWLEGMKEGIFIPQSHGREHLNVSEWMQALQSGNRDVRFGFELGMPGIIPQGDENGSANRYVEALRYLNLQDKKKKLEIVLHGLSIFEELFGYRSKSFIPNNYLWSPDFDEQVARNGVRFYQGNRRMGEIQEDGSKKYHTHHLGRQNEYGQVYLVRNAVFEPSLHKLNVRDPVENCILDISAAFRLNKPAIITSHRLNYVGFIDPSNRDRNLRLLDQLLKKIIRKWPDTEFLNSVELGHLIAGEDQ